MKSRTIKLKPRLDVVGYASLVLILLFAVILINPATQDQSYASCIDGTETQECVGSLAKTDLSMTTNTVISLTLDRAVDMEVTPKSTGAVMESSARVGVSTNSSEGYAIYLKSGNSDGALLPITNNIDGEISNTELSDVTLDNLKTNSYGYALTNVPASGTTTYSRIPTEGQIIQSTDTVTVGSGEYAYGDEYYLSFGTKIGTSLPAGTYAGSVVLSVIANPTTLRSLYDLTYMQEMTPELCAATGEHYTKRLIDTRDGKSYWVAKLKDGNCWMTQNLALDITEEGLKAADTDITEDWNQNSQYPPMATNSEKFEGKPIYPANTKANSWNLGKTVLAIPTANRSCQRLGTSENPGESAWSADTLGEVCRQSGFVDVGFAEWSDTYVATKGTFVPEGGTSFTGLVAVDEPSKSYDAHYLIGNYYSFSTATAGTGITDVNGDPVTRASGSICPKGWTLPTAGEEFSDTSGSFAYLYGRYGFTNNVSVQNTLFEAPLYLTRAGSVYTPTGWVTYAGHQVRLWSGVNNLTRNGWAYALSIANSISTISTSDSRSMGYPLRCLAR